MTARLPDPPPTRLERDGGSALFLLPLAILVLALATGIFA
jgi:hypothetical protein